MAIARHGEFHQLWVFGQGNPVSYRERRSNEHLVLMDPNWPQADLGTDQVT